MILFCLLQTQLSPPPSFHGVCNVSACLGSTPNHENTTLQRSNGDSPTPNNFHSGLTDQHHPHLTARQGRRKCVRRREVCVRGKVEDESLLQRSKRINKEIVDLFSYGVVLDQVLMWTLAAISHKTPTNLFKESTRNFLGSCQ